MIVNNFNFDVQIIYNIKVEALIIYLFDNVFVVILSKSY